MLDLAGLALDAEDRELLRHPAVGGVILFARNYADPDQLRALTADIRALRTPPLLIAADQEGGRVQRFREGFTRLPAAGRLGRLHDADPTRARSATAAVAWLMAVELRAAGVDFSFAPVLDLDRGLAGVIGDRGFGAGVRLVGDLGLAWMEGARRAGMAAVGKHFPGHGGVTADSHTELPVDERAFADFEMEDLAPFARLIGHGLEAIMPAHVVYPRVDSRPAGFSPVWLRGILRGRLGFEGAIFSDDLGMAAAAVAGGAAERARAALEAGCDMLLVCNSRAAAIAAIAACAGHEDPAARLRLLRMHGRGQPPDPARLHEHPDWRRALDWIARLDAHETLALDLRDPTRPRTAGAPESGGSSDSELDLDDPTQPRDAGHA